MGLATGYGTLQAFSNEDIDRQERRDMEQRLAEQRQAQPVISGLAGHVLRCWEAAKQAKQPIEERMIQSMRQRQGEYAPDELARIRETGGCETYLMLTDEKCAAAEAWLEDILLPADDKPWGVNPTPVPELPPEAEQQVWREVDQHFRTLAMQAAQQEVMASGAPVSSEEFEQVVARLHQHFRQQVDEYRQMALKRLRDEAKKADATIEGVINDELLESGWIETLRAAMPNLVDFPAGFIKGPIVRRKPRLKWAPGGGVEVVKELVNEFEAPSPFDIYPAPSSSKVGDGFLIERHRLSRSDLQALIGVSGYDESAIRAVLELYGRGGLSSWLSLANETTRRELENHRHEEFDPDGKIDALQFWGPVQGRQLIDFGVPKEDIEDPDIDYAAEVWVIGSWVIKAELNGDPLGRPPYHKASFRNIHGSFWGMGLPELIKDCQQAANAAAREIINNMALGSGPQVGVDTGAMAPGEDITEIFPRKIWQFDLGDNPVNRQPIWFFQPQMVVAELMAVYDKFSAEADNKSGVPRYAYGAETKGGALSTSSGLSMMLNVASRGIKRVVRNIDWGFIESSVLRMYQHLRLYDLRPELRGGDIKIIARGSSALIAKDQQQVRRNEAMQAVLNPMVLQVIGLRGLAYVLREWFAGLDMDVDKIVPAEEEVLQMMQAQQQQQQALTMQRQQQPARQPRGRELDPAGNPVAGQDARLF